MHQKYRLYNSGKLPRTIFLATGSEAMECCLRYAKHLKEKPGFCHLTKAIMVSLMVLLLIQFLETKYDLKNFSYKIDLQIGKTTESHKTIYEEFN